MHHVNNTIVNKRAQKYCRHVYRTQVLRRLSMAFILWFIQAELPDFSQSWPGHFNMFYGSTQTQIYFYHISYSLLHSIKSNVLCVRIAIQLVTDILFNNKNLLNKNILNYYYTKKPVRYSIVKTRPVPFCKQHLLVKTIGSKDRNIIVSAQSGAQKWGKHGVRRSPLVILKVCRALLIFSVKHTFAEKQLSFRIKTKFGWN